MTETTAETTLRESLFVIATRAEAELIAGHLIFTATSMGLFRRAPRLSIAPDWGDRCDLVDAWAADRGVERCDVELPPSVGVWTITIDFEVEDTEAEADRVGFAGMAQAVATCIRTSLDCGVDPRSPSEGVYYFSLIGDAREAPADGLPS